MDHKQDERLALSQNEQIQNVDISQIKANPYQPRKTFDDEKLSDLATSIQTHGILQPIVLRQTVQGYYIV
ncbi:ParB N-terminal domain-containing protein, partial [Staphylococcus aureus]|nr:ParB N-terminal domain-containing protein [Staphylococcus aureus]